MTRPGGLPMRMRHYSFVSWKRRGSAHPAPDTARGGEERGRERERDGERARLKTRRREEGIA